MSKRISKIILSVTGVILISRFLGFIREMIIADRFGTTVEYDLYLLALIIPAIIYGIINFSAVYLFVPYLNKKINNNENDPSDLNWKQIWPSFNLTFMTSLIIVILLNITAPLIMKIWGGNYSGEQFEEIVFLTRLLSLMILLSTSEAFMRAFLNVKKIFTYPAGGYIVFNLICISLILLFSEELSVLAIALGLLIGLFLQNIFLFLKISGYKPLKDFSFRIFNNDTKAIISTASILIIIEMINRSYTLIDRYVAGQISDGIIAALNYSQVIVLLPESIVGFAIGSVFFPYFSKLSNNETFDHFGKVYDKVVSGALFIAVLITVFVFLNSKEIVYLLFFRGKFDNLSLELTSNLLLTFAPSIIAFFIITTSIRACYSISKIKLVLFFSVVVFIVKVIGNFAFTELFGYQGITVSSSLSFLLFAILLVITILLSIKYQHKRKFVINIIKITSCGFLTLIFGIYFKEYFLESTGQMKFYETLIFVISNGAVIVIVYLLLSYFSGLKHLIMDFISEKENK